MVPHICSRDECLPVNVSGQKIRCFLCAATCFAKCYNIMENFYEACAPGDPFDDKSNIQFICSYCLDNPNKFAELVERTGSNDPEKTVILTELTEIKLKLDELHTMSADTNKKCHAIEQSSVHRKPGLSFAEVVRKNKEGGSSPIAYRAPKRGRVESPTATANKIVLPKIKQTTKSGTRDMVIGPALPQIASSSSARPVPGLSNMKSIWVSRFHPDTSIDDVMKHIAGAVVNIDLARVTCRKLVKRGTDLSTLNFVSFKIDADVILFDDLLNPDIWPEYIKIREFFDITKKSSTLEPSSLAQVPAVNDNSSTNGMIDSLINLDSTDSNQSQGLMSKN